MQKSRGGRGCTFGVGGQGWEGVYGRGVQAGCVLRIAVIVKMPKKVGGGVRSGLGSVWEGVYGRQRIEVIVKMQKQKLGGVRSGGGSGWIG